MSARIAVCIATATLLVASTEASSASFEYMALAPDALKQPAQDLVNYRAAQDGLRGLVVTTEELVQEYGSVDVRQFVQDLHGAVLWSDIRPYYLVLFGDANLFWPGSTKIPTHNFENQASDSWFVATDPNSNDFAPLIRLGRVPIVSASEGSNYVSKVITYEAAPSAAWMEDALGIVQDNHNCWGSHPSEVYVAAYDDILQNEIGMLPEEIRESDYGPSCPPSFVFDESFYTSSTADIAYAWEQGKGLIFAMGDVHELLPDAPGLCYEDGLAIAGVWDMSLWSSTRPTFIEGLGSSANGKFPFLITAACRVGIFAEHRCGYPGAMTGIVEELLLRRPDRGSIGILTTTGETNIWSSKRICELACEFLFRRGVRDMGRLYAATLNGFQRYGYLDESLRDAKWIILFGDPATKLRLVGTSASTEMERWSSLWYSGMEVWDPLVRQNYQPVTTGADLSGSSSTTVRSGDGVYEESVLSFECSDPGGVPPNGIEWTIAEPNVVISDQARLTWVQKYVGPPPLPVNSRVTVTGRVNGLALDSDAARDTGIIDQSGSGLGPDERPPLPGFGWRRYYVDLSPLAGQTLESLSVKYEGLPGAPYEFEFWFDDVRVLNTWGVSSVNEILNYHMGMDFDGDDIPDYWVPDADVSVWRSDRGTLFRPSLAIVSSSFGQGVSHIAHSSSDVPAYKISCYGAQEVGADADMRVSVRDIVNRPGFFGGSPS